MKFPQQRPTHLGVIATVLAANLLAASHAQAALSYTTVHSLSLESTLSGPPGNWYASLNGQPITDSRTSDWRAWLGTSRPVGWGYSSVSLSTSGINQPTGPIDFVVIAHGTMGGFTSWNSTGSISVSFDRAVLFYFSSGTNNTWSFGGSVIAQGTRFETGTYTFNFASVYPSAAGLREWSTTAYFESVAVPAPCALTIMGATGLLGRRRRA
jgi:hypothetical protein